MSSCQYAYKFYFSSAEYYQHMASKITDITDSDTLLESLDLTRHMDSDREHLEYFKLTERYLYLDFMTSTTSDINHRLVRAFKDYGCEYCYLDMYNDQVGEGEQLHLFRGKDINGEKLDAVLEKYEPQHKFVNAIKSNPQGLIQQIKSGQNPNQLINGQLPLSVAIAADNFTSFKILLKSGADVNAVNSHKQTALISLLESADNDELKYANALIKMGADLNAVDAEGASVLWLAPMLDRRLPATLIKMGAKMARPEGAYSEDNEAFVDNLATAMAHNDKEMIQKYFPLAITNTANWPRIAADCCSYDQLAVFKALTKKGFNFFEDEDGDQCFDLISSAAAENALSVLNALLQLAQQQNIDLSPIAEELLESLAGQQNSAPIFKVLLDQYSAHLTDSVIDTAIEGRSINNIKMVLASGFVVDKNLEEEEDETNVLHRNLGYLTAESAQLLLDTGCDPMHVYYEQTVVERALEDDDISAEVKAVFAQQLQSLPAKQSIFIALKSQHSEQFQYAWQQLDDKTITNDEGCSLLMLACQSDNAEITRFLIAQGCPLEQQNEQGNTALALATIGGHTETAIALLEAGANANTKVVISKQDEDEDDDESALTGLFPELDTLAKVSEQVTEYVELEGEDSSCLMHAANAGQLSFIEALIKHGADVNYTDDDGFTAIAYCVYNNNIDAFDYLLSQGLDAKALDNEGLSLLHIAAHRGLPQFAKKLIALGLDVNLATSSEKQTPLLIAAPVAFLHDEDVCSLLIDAGADIDATDDNNSSALIYAVISANHALIRKLLEKGASTNSVDGDAKLAYDYFLELELAPEGYDSDALKPTSSTIKLKKMVQIARNIIVKQLVPLAIVAGIVGYFSPTWGRNIVIMFIAFHVLIDLWRLKKRFSPPPKKSKSESMMELGFKAIGRAMDENTKTEKDNKAVIDSWDDADTKA